MLNHANAPWYTDAELSVLNEVAAELVAARRSANDACVAVHRAWFAGATISGLRRAVAAHRDPRPDEPEEADWQ
jgi:hypothetical protein